jgi:Bifunctional DNA primase/polymerase, N-terminal
VLGVIGMPDHQDAAALVGRGLAVFPLPAGGKTAEQGWQQACTSELALLARSWPAGANIGVGCRASGVAGLDLDRHAGAPDGVASFARLCADQGLAWPATFTVATPNGGLHLYFRVPPGCSIASAIGWLPGVDVRGPGRRLGGYLAGPGSVVGGRRYEVVADLPIAGLPGWLEGLLAENPGRRLLRTCRPGVGAAAECQ